MHNISLQLSLEVKKHDRGSEKGKNDKDGHDGRGGQGKGMKKIRQEESEAEKES